MYGKMGQIKPGLQELAEALALVEKTGERHWEGELYRLKGELLLHPGVQPPDAEAETCFRQALEVARGQEMKLLALPAAVSLSRLWQ
jgi:predicted ATPase